MATSRGWILALGASALLPFGELAAQERSRETEAVRAREIAFAQTMADRDHDAFLTYLAPDAVFFAGNEATLGAEAVGAAWARFFEDPVAPFSWQPDVIEVLASGDLALSSGPVRNTAGEVTGRFNSIWRLYPDGE